MWELHGLDFESGAGHAGKLLAKARPRLRASAHWNWTGSPPRTQPTRGRPERRRPPGSLPAPHRERISACAIRQPPDRTGQVIAAHLPLCYHPPQWTVCCAGGRVRETSGMVADGRQGWTRTDGMAAAGQSADRCSNLLLLPTPRPHSCYQATGALPRPLPHDRGNGDSGIRKGRPRCPYQATGRDRIGAGALPRGPICGMPWRQCQVTPAGGQGSLREVLGRRASCSTLDSDLAGYPAQAKAI